MVANFDSNVGFAWWLMEAYWAEIAWGHAPRKRVFLAYPTISKIPDIIERAPIECVELDVAGEIDSGSEGLASFLEENAIEQVYWTDGPLLDRCYAEIRRHGVENIVVHTHRAVLPTNAGLLRNFAKKLIQRWGGYSANWNVAVSSYVQKTLESNAGVPSARILCVGSGIDLARLDGHVESELALPPADVRVAMMGRIDPGKGIEFAIEVFCHLRDLETSRLESDREPALPRIQLVHIGTGTMREEVEERIESERLSDRFSLLGYQKNVGAILRECDIGFHPSEGEVGYSLAILEMLSQKLPMVLPDKESVKGAIEDTDCWTGYRAGDVAEAAERLLALAMDPEKRRRMGEAGRSLISSDFDLERCLDRFRERVVPLFD